MASKTKSELQKNITTTKSFSYIKDDTNLSFSLNVDNSSQVRKFKSLLEEAIRDLDQELNNMKN